MGVWKEVWVKVWVYGKGMGEKNEDRFELGDAPGKKP